MQIKAPYVSKIRLVVTLKIRPTANTIDLVTESLMQARRQVGGKKLIIYKFLQNYIYVRFFF